MSKVAEAIRDKFKDQESKWGADRCRGFYEKIEEIVDHYAKHFSVTQEEMFNILEAKRTYSFPNYYQDANFPLLDDSVRIFESIAHLRREIDISQGFRCPSCSAISKDPYDCSNPPCDWKAYGFLKTLGKGLRIMVKDQFRENPRVDEIFMPVSLEVKTSNKG